MIEGSAQYLATLQRFGGPGFEADACPDIPGRGSGFIVNRSGNGPPLLYLPGFQGDDILFFRIRPLLDPHFKVISVAWRSDGPHTAQQYARDVLDAMDVLGLERAVLIGESMGSIPALTLAIQHPQRVSGLVLAGGFSQSVHRSLIAMGRIVLPILPLPIARWGIRRVMPLAFHRQCPEPRLAPELIRLFSDLRHSEHRRDSLQRLKMIASWDCRANLQRIECPTFYLGGAWDEIVAVHRESAELQRALPATRVLLIPRCPHPVLFFRPDAASQTLVEWLRPAAAPSS